MTKDSKGKYQYGHVIAATCFCIQFVGIGTYFSYGVLFNPLLDEFGWTRASISGAGSMAFLLMGLLGIGVGRLNDRFGPRVLMTISGVFYGLGYFLMSRLESVWQLYFFFTIIFGIGLSTVDVIPLTTIARWFIRKRGIVTGIVKVGTGAGQMVIPFLVSVLIIHYGWRSTSVIVGVAVLIILVTVAQLLRRDPGQMGLLPDGESPGATDSPVGEPEGLSLSEAVRTRQFWTICSAKLAIVFCLMTVMVHIVPFAREIKISPTIAAGLLATIGGVSMAGRFFSGIALDRIGSKRVMIISFILLIAVFLWLQIATRLWMLYLFSVFYGLSHGGFFTSFSPIVAEFFGIKSHGVLFGITMFCGTFGGALGPITAGYVFDVTGAYAGAIWICILISLIGVGLVATLKPALKEKR
jgi:MFS family permease